MIGQLQARLKALLEADPAFAGITVLTDERPDLVNQIAQELGKRGFVVVIGFAVGTLAGKADSPKPILTERFQIQFIQHRLDKARDPLALAEEAMRILHRQPVQAGGLGPQRFFVEGHRTDFPDESTRVVSLTVQTLVHLT